MTRWNRALAALLALVLVVVAACNGGDSNEPDCDAIAAALVSRIEVTPASSTVNLGDSLQLAATAYSCAGALSDVRTFAWRSANAAIATVSATGLVKAVTSGGPVAIFAEAQGKEGSSAITTRPVPVDRVTVEPATATLGVNRTSTLTVRAFDAQDREILGRPVTWSSANPAIVSVNPSGGITGVAPGGPVAVTATIEGKSDASQVTVVLVPVNSVTVAPTTATIAAGTTQQFTATLRDELGNVLTGRAVNWTSSDPAIATITGAGGLASGLRPGTVTITATSEGRSGTAQLTVNIGAAARLAFVQQPSTVQAGSAIAPAVTVEILDAAGNRVTTGSPTVTLGLTPGGATLGGNTATASNGLATFNALTVSAAGTFSLTASSTGLTGATSSAFVVTARPATRLAFVQPPTNVVAGANITPAVTVELLDAVGDRVTTSGTPVTIAIGANPGTGTLGGTATQNSVNGLATFANLTINRSGTGYTLVASATGLTGATSATFNVTAGTATRVGFITEPCPTPCALGSALAPSPRVAIQDALGNTVTTSTATVAVSLLGGQGGPTLGGTTSVAAVAGIATFSTLTVSRTSTGLTLRAASGALAPDTSAAFSVVNSGPQLFFSTQPPASVAAGATLPTVRVQLQDAQGGNVATAGVQVSLALGPSGTLGGTLTRATDAAGVATFSDLSVAALVGTSYTLTATATGYLSEVSNTFAVTVGAPARLTFTQQPPASVTVGVAITPAVTVQLRDAGLNAVAQGGTSVALAMSGGGVLTNAAATTNASGVATFTGLTATATAGPGYSLTASSAGLAAATSNTFSVVAGAGTRLGFVQQPPATVTSGVAITPAVSVRLLDAASNPVTTSGVTITLAASPSGSITGGSAATASGVATFTGLTLTAAPGTGYSFSASAGGYTGATSNSFSVVAGALATLAFVQQPTSEVAGVSIAPAVTVVARDAGSNPVPGAVVTLSVVTGPVGATLNDASATTNASGVATFTGLDATVAGTYTIRAASGAVQSAASNAFVISPAAAAVLAIRTQPTGGTAGGLVTPTVQVEARDAFANLATGYTSQVVLGVATGPVGGSLSNNSTSAVGGIATFTGMTVSTAGVYTLGASATGLTGATTNSFTVASAPATQLVFTAVPGTGTALQSLTPAITVEARDAGGNLVTTFTGPVSLAIGTNPGSATLSGGGPVNAVGGIATFSAVQISVAGNGYTLVASSAGLTSDTSAPINIAAAAVGGATQLGFLVQPTNVNAGAAISPPVQVEVRDAGGSRVTTSAATVVLVFGNNAGGATLSGSTAQAASGVATFADLRVSAPGNGYTLVATSDGLTSATSSGFRVR